MANVYINSTNTQRKGRNGRVYAGNSFNPGNPNQVPTQSFKHWEHGKVSDISDRNVIVEFSKPFVNTPTLINLKVFRMVENIPTPGKWIRQDVLHYFDDDEDWFIKVGFSLYVDLSEPLAGVIIEYCFTE